MGFEQSKRLGDYNEDSDANNSLFGKIFFHEETIGRANKPRMVYRVVGFGINNNLLDVEDLESPPRYDSKGNNLNTINIGRKKHSTDIEIDKRIVSTFMGSRCLDTRFLANYRGMLV